MGKLGGIALIVAAAAGLAACSAPSSSTPAPNETKQVSATEATASAAPIKAQSAAPAEVRTTTGEDPPRFLRSAKWRWGEGYPSDDELLSAGRLACEQLRKVPLTAKVVVVTGEPEGSRHNSAVAAAARDNLCRDTLPKR